MTEAVSSPEAEELVAAGARPVEVDVDAILAQVAAMQAQIDRLNAERGVPSNPVASAVQNLVHHVKARAAQNPTHDLSVVLAELEALPEELSSKDAERVRNILDDVMEDCADIRHELSYLPRLARDLHTVVLAQETGH